MISKTFLRTLAAAIVAAVPLTGFSRDDGHGHSDRGNFDHGNFDRGHFDHGHFFGPRFYGGFYGDPYYYDRPYFWGPGVGFSYYYSRPNVYRGYVADDRGDSLGAEVQYGLRRRGYYHGPIDGSIGPGSRAAIRAFQANHGLNVTGRIDHSLTHALGIY